VTTPAPMQATASWVNSSLRELGLGLGVTAALTIGLTVRAKNGRPGWKSRLVTWCRSSLLAAICRRAWLGRR
jgi:cyanate permease